MNQTIEDRMQSVEDQLKEIRRELEESLARYKKYNPLTDYDWPTPVPKDLQTKCLWESIPVEAYDNWVIDPVFLEGVGDDSKLVGLIEDYFNWEEADWSENKLFYEYDLEHLEGLPTKEKKYE